MFVNVSPSSSTRFGNAGRGFVESFEMMNPCLLPMRLLRVHPNYLRSSSACTVNNPSLVENSPVRMVCETADADMELAPTGSSIFSVGR